MKTTIANYVAGFMFSKELDWVSLIRKTKPAWQNGLLNGVGGKIEEGESHEFAMHREFKEETGHQLQWGDWKYFCVLSGPDFRVHFFTAVGDLKALNSMEDEKLELIHLSQINLLRKDMIENLPWLISLALDHLNDGRPKFVTAEYP